VRSSHYQDLLLATLDRPVKVRGCDCPGCGQAGDFRAPKSRDRLTEYYWFCFDHVRDYNARWDYLAGLSATAIENHIRNAAVWERPTWPLGEWQRRERELRDKVNRAFFEDCPDDFELHEAKQPSLAEREALAILELTPPVDFPAIKAQYRLLVKKHHPDANGGSRKAEEKFKTITKAFATLRAFYEDSL
jgi:hypothetical protein